MTDSQRTEIAAGAFFGGAVTAALLRDAQALAGLQCELLSGAEAFWAEYARRQSETLETSIQALHAVCDGRGLLEIAQIQRDWLASAARRTADNIGQWAGDSAAFSRATAASAERAVAANESMPQPAPEREAAE